MAPAREFRAFHGLCQPRYTGCAQSRPNRHHRRPRNKANPEPRPAEIATASEVAQVVPPGAGAPKERTFELTFENQHGFQRETANGRCQNTLVLPLHIRNSDVRS